MDKQSDHIADLLHKKWLGILTNEEQSELERWLSANAANREFSEYLSSQIPKAEIRIRAINLEKIASEINSQLSTDITVYYETDQVQQQPAKVYLLKKSIFKYAAAVLLLLIGAAVYYVYNSSENIPVKTTPVVADNILPGSQRATLILSNGKQITLNNVISETIADGNASIKNDQGQLIYDSGKGVGFNTMSTPRGGQYKLTLSDGTRVWINAASSISYPTVFTGKTREVNITGEAYFEVAANKTKPFIVKTSTDIIEVIGTDFNVNAYNDEPAIKTSLINGSVKIGNKILKPGDAYANKNIVRTNIEQDVAWKNGIFSFNEKKLSEVMRQLARWYDIDVHFVGDVADIKLFGEADRNLSLNDLLKGYEGEIAHFELKGRTLFVKPL